MENGQEVRENWCFNGFKEGYKCLKWVISIKNKDEEVRGGHFSDFKLILILLTKYPSLFLCLGSLTRVGFQFFGRRVFIHI